METEKRNAPFERANRSTANVMTDVVISLFPALGASAFIFGGRGLMLTGFCMICAIAFERICNLCKREKSTVGDLSAAVTGLIFSMCMPVTFSYLKAALGVLIAIVVAKQLFGGLGKNIFNPAAFGAAAMMLIFRNDFKEWVIPFYDARDAVTGATPLETGTESYSALFLGNTGGALGETCAAALLIGGMYLTARLVINPIVPFSFILTVFGFSYLTGNDGIYQVLGGGLMLGAFFMATDGVTSPMTYLGKLIFGIGCGVLTCVLRFYTPLSEGVIYAILIMNLLARPIDSAVIALRRYPLEGGGKEE